MSSAIKGTSSLPQSDTTHLSTLVPSELRFNWKEFVTRRVQATLDTLNEYLSGARVVSEIVVNYLYGDIKDGLKVKDLGYIKAWMSLLTKGDRHLTAGRMVIGNEVVQFNTHQNIPTAINPEEKRQFKANLKLVKNEGALPPITITTGPHAYLTWARGVLYLDGQHPSNLIADLPDGTPIKIEECIDQKWIPFTCSTWNTNTDLDAIEPANPDPTVEKKEGDK